MKNTIKLIAAGAIALTAISAAQAQDVTVGPAGSKTFVGSLKITPGKYVAISLPGVGSFGNNAVSETINAVTIAGTIVTSQGGGADATVSKSISSKLTNKSILNHIYEGSTPRGAKLVWVVEGANGFEEGQLGGLVGLVFTPAPEVFSLASTGSAANLIVTSKTVAKKTGKPTTNYQGTVNARMALDYTTPAILTSVSGVGKITETVVEAGDIDYNKVSGNLPLSGTYVAPAAP